ncbi:MAG: hypothetical protein ACLU37_04225 [Collinsella sp.]
MRGINLAQASAMTLGEAIEWVRGVPTSLPAEMQPMAADICDSFLARPVVWSTGSRLSFARLAPAPRSPRANASACSSPAWCATDRRRALCAGRALNRLHPANVDGLVGVMRDLVDDGNTVVVVDHDTRVLAEADYLVEMGPVAGAGGGNVIAAGTWTRSNNRRAAASPRFCAPSPSACVRR